MVSNLKIEKCGNSPQVLFGFHRTKTTVPDVQACGENAGNLFAGCQLRVSFLFIDLFFLFSSQNDASWHTILSQTMKRISREFLEMFW